MNRLFVHIFSLVCLVFALGSCSIGDIIPDGLEEIGEADRVELSFTIKANHFSSIQSPLRTTNVTDRPLEYGEDAGTEKENQIKNLWVLLFDNSDDELKYIFEFTKEAADPENQLKGPYEQLNGMYLTPVKLVKPGRYTLVISCNTYQHSFRNDHASVGFKEAFRDVIQPTLGMKRSVFGSKAGGNLHFVNADPAHDRESYENGLNANYIDYNFIVPKNYTSKREPFIVPVSLSRALSKLVVTIDNLSDTSGEIPQTQNYKLVEVVVSSSRLYKLYLQPYYTSPIGGFMNTAWYTHAILPRQGENYNVKPNNGLMKNSFPLLRQLNEQGFPARLEESELFNFYIPAWAKGSAPQTATTNTTKIKIVFQHRTSLALLTYEIPLYNIINGEKDYTIRQNTLYKLRLSFRGPRLTASIE